MRLVLPYGELPKKEQFNRAILESKKLGKLIRIRNDPRLGNQDISDLDLYHELQKAKKENTQESLEWCKTHLLSMSIEWQIS